MFAAARRGKFNSEPRRCRLSRATICKSGNWRFSASARLDPTKPAPPVTRIQLCMNMIGFWARFVAGRAMIISPRKVLLQPEIHYDEKVPAAHFLELQFRNSRLPRGPLDWNDGI